MTLGDAAVLTALVLNLLGLVGLGMRLWWQVKQQKGHRRYIEALARALPDGSRIDDVHGAGRRTRLTIGPGKKAKP